ncbi:MAG: sensor histidine kinase [Lachnospiraceae bacterium]|nr:sensor histidine kinase [Lachnospiraceae bacterium]
MKHNIKRLRHYIPWLCVLLCVDAFSAVLLWIADAAAFYSMLTVILTASILLFFAVSCVLLYRSEEKEKAFKDFLNNPDEYNEEKLLRAVSSSQREFIKMLSKRLQENDRNYSVLSEKLNDYEEYVEKWAHETKTPLSLLTLLLDNRRDELPASVSFKLDYIRNRINESIEQILYYARLKGARKDYLFENVDLRVCIEDVTENCKPLLEEKCFQIYYDLSDISVYTDRRAIYFILNQIADNAIKYCKDSPKLYFKLTRQEKYDILSIRDNGIGVKKCDLPYIFEKGFTGYSGESQKKATGMGLYLVDGIAKDLNLSVNVNTEWGKGFEIQFLFPIVKVIEK